jgi:hypothetical protein
MVVVKHIERSRDPRHALHPTSTACRAYVVHAADGQRLLQLETFGSRGRKHQGKTSQTTQFTRDALVQLRDLIDEVLR